MMLIGGFNVAMSALGNCPERVATLYLDVKRLDKRAQNLVHLANQQNIAVQRCHLADLALDLPKNHQGIVLKLRSAKPANLDQFLTRHNLLILILDGIMDPRNLGALMRVAAASAVDGIILSKNRCSPITETVHRCSAGASFKLPTFLVSNLDRCLVQLKKSGIWIIGADASTEQSLYDTDLLHPVAVVMGNEEKGLRKLTRNQCDYLVRIPMALRMDSLNVASAAAVILFEAYRQRHQDLK